MGIEKGKLPNITIICSRTGAEIYPPITMNGIIIDITSPEFIRRIQEIVTLPPSLLHETVEIIDTTYNKYFDDKSPGMRKKVGPYDILLKVQAIVIQLQNRIFAAFANIQPIEAKIKEHSRNVITNHHEAITVKEQLVLAIAMSEMANSVYQSFRS